MSLLAALEETKLRLPAVAKDRSVTRYEPNELCYEEKVTLSDIMEDMVDVFNVDICAITTPGSEGYKILWFSKSKVMKPYKQVIQSSRLFKAPFRRECTVIDDLSRCGSLQNDPLVVSPTERLMFYAEAPVLGPSGKTILGSLVIAHVQPCKLAENGREVLESVASQVAEIFLRDAGETNDLMLPHLDIADNRIDDPRFRFAMRNRP
mmetsp:Transcript_32348/g.58743  ORF Transcript_32348/g.58743 Transcript_32348/m.58743 type:complete len:207 (+) Transcript_32348:131-751(+)|eukprot:CAMPEP_0197654692 /NCGR_PEP_ID=MMETSP1338-20131121/39003_1 /TAXON_ID=43686 ORGANISM="Pelagodinium beii, Strain RCC1491" /NCGR_SAMPLE_ID=MMETSP1338 /ASSEMBLY_ACC=CAM_ASM_000754 /LENGTH=206 /DNA_ID=CAMNT_0043230187 /DNA_START=34 /DNA_END=654 /DNA_ORIENTATION=-